MGAIIIDILTSLLQTIVCLTLFYSLFPSKEYLRHEFLYLACSVLVITGFLSLYVLFDIAFPPNITPLLLGSFLYLRLFRKGSWFIHLFLSILFLSMVGAVTLGMFTVLEMGWGIDVYQFTYDLHIRLPASGILILLYVLFSILINFIFKKIRGGEVGFSPIYTGIIIVPILAIIVLLMLIDDEYGRNSWFSSRLSLFVALGLIVLNLVTLLLWFRIMRQEAEASRLREETRLAKLQLRHQEDISATYQQMRAWRHDYHNHVQAMAAMLTMGNYEELKNYLNDCAREFSKIENVATTGNTTVDALLSVKKGIAVDRNIAVDIRAVLPDSLPFPEGEFCVLLGNLLDNAIEACEIIKDVGFRFIELNVHPEAAHLHITVRNSTDGTERIDDGEFRTRKADTTLHGIGLKSIDRIVYAYGGFCARAHSNHVFETNILIPLMQIKSLEKEEDAYDSSVFYGAH